MKRAEILKEAEKCVCGNREQDYGSLENNFRTIAAFWATYLNSKHDSDVCITIDPEDVAAMLALLKIARIASGRMKDDNWIDLAGYAACGGEIAAEREAFNSALNSILFVPNKGREVSVEPRTGLITEDAGEGKPWVAPKNIPSEGLNAYKGAFDPS